MPLEYRTSVAPDWVCEILSPRTARLDQVRQLPIHARHAVGHFWLIDPTLKTLEVFRLESGKWSLLASFADIDAVRAEPYHEVEIDPAALWMDDWGLSQNHYSARSLRPLPPWAVCCSE
jgi:Uma2 family endonuclease